MRKTREGKKFAQVVEQDSHRLSLWSLCTHPHAKLPPEGNEDQTAGTNRAHPLGTASPSGAPHSWLSTAWFPRSPHRSPVVDLEGPSRVILIPKAHKEKKSDLFPTQCSRSLPAQRSTLSQYDVTSFIMQLTLCCLLFHLLHEHLLIIYSMSATV